MRTLFLATLVLLTAGICLSQTLPTENSGTTSKLTLSTPQGPFTIHPLPLVADRSMQKGAPADSQLNVLPIMESQPACYTMRTYFFSKGAVGSPPQLTGSATCIPSSKIQIRQIRPRLKLLPQ